MLQTDRKTETTKRTSQEREQTQRRQSRETKVDPAQALQAILNGGGWEQLPTESMLSLSHQMGNAALQEVLALRGAGAETGLTALPETPCETAPVEWGGGGFSPAEAPAFGAMQPMGALAPLEV